MDRRAPSARWEAQLAELLSAGIADQAQLAEVGRLGAQVVLQRAGEADAAAFLGRARDERPPDARGSRNGTRPRRGQPAEGELTGAVPQVRGATAPFLSRVLPRARGAIRTRPREALVIGAYAR